MKPIMLILASCAVLGTLSLRAQDAVVEERLNRLSGQLEDLQAARVRLDKQMSDLLKELGSLREQMAKPTGNFASQDELRKLAEKLQEIDQKRVADNERILREIEKLARAGAGARPPVKVVSETGERTGAAGPEKGYEHVVQSGDNLSTIALAYREKGIKVTTDQILKANPGLKANSLRIGQKIFIPAP